MLLFTRLAAEPLSAEQRLRAVRLPLDHDTRARSRFAIVLAEVGAVAANLPRGTPLRDGTMLVDEAGHFGMVVAAPQPLARVRCDDALGLLQATYHLANRHVPVQLAADALLIERDAVLERMLIALGARIEHIEAPFEPESGAYDAHGHHHRTADDDNASATLGEQLSIEAHRARTSR